MIKPSGSSNSEAVLSSASHVLSMKGGGPRWAAPLAVSVRLDLEVHAAHVAARRHPTAGAGLDRDVGD